MENPHGTPVPEPFIVAFDFIDFDGFTIPFVVATHRQRNGKWRACFFWHRQHDKRLRQQLLTCLKIWARAQVQISDVKCIQSFAVKIGDAGRVSRFKIIGAHRDLGHLFPVFLLPFAIGKMVKPAAERLQQEISNRITEATDDAV